MNACRVWRFILGHVTALFMDFDLIWALCWAYWNNKVKLVKAQLVN